MRYLCNMPSSWERIILHVDMDAFYASVEQLENPALRGQPVIVGGVDSTRGVVSSASYEARAFGVRSAMPVREARRKCPQGIYIAGRHSLYLEYSRRLMQILDDFSPIVEAVSVDEAFLDLTGTTGLWGLPLQAAARLQEKIRAELLLSASVGVAENKFLAKLASDFRKPAGITLVEPGQTLEFLDPLPAERLWGVGKKSSDLLHAAGFHFIRHIREQTRERIQEILGENLGKHVHDLAFGHDNRELSNDTGEKSLSHEHTFETDCAETAELESILLEMSDKVAFRARKQGLMGRTVTLVWRDPDFSRHSRSKTLGRGTQSGGEIHAVTVEALQALIAEKKGRRSFRLLGVRLSHFSAPGEQLTLWDQAPKVSQSLDKALDAVRSRFGEDAIRRGRHLE